MSQDVFSREVSYGGSFSADSTRITFSDFGAGMLTQQLSWQYQQNITRLYEVGSADIYLVSGRTQGQVTMQRVIGPKKLLPAFYKKFGDVCNARSNHMKFSGNVGCGSSTSGSKQTIDIKNVVIQQVGGSVQAESNLIQESLGLMFLALQIS